MDFEYDFEVGLPWYQKLLNRICCESPLLSCLLWYGQWREMGYFPMEAVELAKQTGVDVKERYTLARKKRRANRKARK